MNTGIISSLPDILDPDSEIYDASKIVKNEKFYIYNNEIVYINARLDLFKKASLEILTWILWLNADSKEFYQFAEDPNASRGLFNARLCSDVYFYENTNGLDVTLDFKRRDKDFNPSVIVLKPEIQNALYDDYINGIEPERFSLWLGKLNGE